MRHSIRAVLAASVAVVATTTLGAVPASAEPEGYPRPGAWESYEDTTVFPAKTACADEVSAHEVASVRVIELSKKARYIEFDDASTVTFTNTRTKKSWATGEGGDGFVRSLKGDYDTFTVTAQGENWAQGKGVYGIPWSRGYISFTETHANEPPKTTYTKFDLTRAETFIQVCYQVGTTPVAGKNVVPEGQPTARSALRR